MLALSVRSLLVVSIDMEMACRAHVRAPTLGNIRLTFTPALTTQVSKKDCASSGRLLILIKSSSSRKNEASASLILPVPLTQL